MVYQISWSQLQRYIEEASILHIIYKVEDEGIKVMAGKFAAVAPNNEQVIRFLDEREAYRVFRAVPDLLWMMG